jgi:phage terminase large subunit-like protein
VSKAVQRWVDQAYAKWVLEDTYRFAEEMDLMDLIEPQPHREMADEINAMMPDFSATVQRKKLFLSPRFTYKTTLVEADIVRTILKYQDIAIIVFRANRELARQIVGNVKLNLTTNPKILETFGNVAIGSTKWSEDEFIVNNRTRPRRESTVFAAGIDVSTTGLHADRIYCDDLVTDKNCDSIAEQTRAKNLVQSLNPVLAPWGTALFTGTIWSNIDCWNWMLQQNRKIQEWNELHPDQPKTPPYETYIRSVYYTDADGTEKLFFPNKITEEFLEQQRNELQPRWYYAWYHNQTYESGLKPFTNLQFFDGDYYAFPYRRVILTDEAYAGEEVPISVAMMIDPALTASASSDSFGINVVGFDSQGNWLVLESRELRKLPDEATFDIVELLMDYEPNVLIVESANADVSMMARIGEAAQDLRSKCNIVSYSALQDEARGQRGKAQRIGALQPLFNQKKVYLRRNRCGPLVRQLDLYPGIEHDDVLDSLSMGRKASTLVPQPDTMDTIDDGAEVVDSWRVKMRGLENARHPQGKAQKERKGILNGAWTGKGTQRYKGTA